MKKCGSTIQLESFNTCSKLEIICLDLNYDTVKQLCTTGKLAQEIGW